MTIEVECYKGYRGEQIPRRITMGQRTIGVVEVLDQWLSPDHRYFKVVGDDCGLYIIRHDEREHRWELTFFKQLEGDDKGA